MVEDAPRGAAVEGPDAADPPRRSSPRQRHDASPRRPAEPANGSPSSFDIPALASASWQAPMILLSVVLIGWALTLLAADRDTHDFDAALAQVEQWMAASTHVGAARDEHPLRQRLKEIEKYLGEASRAQQGRFHAVLADYLFASREEEGVDFIRASQRAVEHYDKAMDLGVLLTWRRHEQRALALIDAGDLGAAGKFLRDLDADPPRTAEEPEPIPAEADEADEAALAAATPEAAPKPRTREFVRSTVRRHLLDAQLRDPSGAFEEQMTLLTEFRMDPASNARPEDEIWAIARQAELRLRRGRTQQAVDLLLVEMRRLEGRGVSESSAGLAELYLLLGRGYFDLGDYPRAQANLERAVSLFGGPERECGDAHVWLGQIAVALGRNDVALERFHIVVRDYITTPSYWRGLLGRAEVHSILGEHAASLADFRLLSDQLPYNTRFGLTDLIVADALCQRHDAALALGKLDVAMEYIALADRLFASDAAPAHVLIRLASTHRQIADDLMAQGRLHGAGAGEANRPSAAAVDPALRRQAAAHYEKAGDAYLRHTHAHLASPGWSRDDASTSQWLAADCFDLAGRVDLAVSQFRRYLDTHPIDDQRRSRTLSRLGRAHQARRDHEEAAQYYEMVVTHHPRTAEAAQSHVPLAQSYAAMGRIDDARQRLRQVLGGDRLLQPDARDYADALLELARIEYADRQYPAAIESLAQFVQRYPTESRVIEAKYLLADSYRGNALAILERLDQEASSPTAEHGRLRALAAEHFQIAGDLFAQIGEFSLGAAGQASPVDRDLVRRAALYRADCAFHLADYAEAVELYDRVARLYSDHASSMYALVQVVNCYVLLNDHDRASAAHQRALVRLKQLPAEAFAVPDVLMDRAAWERWLENHPMQLSRHPGDV